MRTGAKDIILELKDELKIFNLLSKDELEQISSYFEIVRCSAGSTLYKEGDSGDSIGFIASGKLEVKKQTEFEGRQIVIALLTRGSFVGELSLVDEYPRSATVVAQEDSELVVLKREAFESLVQSHPHTGIKILKGLNRILAIRLRKAVDRLTGIF